MPPSWTCQVQGRGGVNRNNTVIYLSLKVMQIQGLFCSGHSADLKPQISGFPITSLWSTCTYRSMEPTNISMQICLTFASFTHHEAVAITARLKSFWPVILLMCRNFVLVAEEVCWDWEEERNSLSYTRERFQLDTSMSS